jgi:tRNA modification GTPase
MRQPRSYTREDVVEVHLPGAPPLVAAVLRELCRAGARIAEPGEFTKRAFLSGRIDLAQAEAVLSVIRSRSDAEEKLALSCLAGNLTAAVSRVRKSLVDLSADIEAGLDFLEDDVSLVSRDRLAAGISSAQSDVAAIVRQSVAERAFREEALVVIHGPVNAGKSTLFNLLAGGEFAIVHEMPGTTRDYLEAIVDLEGLTLTLVDTAGIRPPAELIEEIAVSRSRAVVAGSHLVLFVVDAGVPLDDSVASLYRAAACTPHVVVLNKADRPMVLDAARWIARFGDCPVVEVSASAGRGHDRVRRAILDLVTGGAVDLSAARFLLAERQRRCIDEADAALARARDCVSRGDGDEIVSFEIREAANALGRVTGDSYVEDLLDEVFGRFCLGK